MDYQQLLVEYNKLLEENTILKKEKVEFCELQSKKRDGFERKGRMSE